MGIVALGSNLAGGFASKRELLQAALASLDGAGLAVRRLSRWWRAPAWPDPSDPEYLNGVAIVETDLGARETLAALQTIEQAFGRRRSAPNAPRTLDLDLIDLDGWRMAEPGLLLPHPRAHERLFVMGPLAEIWPQWRHPILGRTAADLAAEAAIGAGATPEA